MYQGQIQMHDALHTEDELLYAVLYIHFTPQSNLTLKSDHFF